MASSGNQLPVGLRYVTAYELLASGLPKAGAVPATAYQGIEFEGPKAFSLNVPEARKITHMGEDRPLAIDYLPPTEGMDGELQVSPVEFNVIALLGSLVMATAAEKTFMPMSTSKQGSEPQVGLLMYQQSLDVALGTRTWRSFIVPSARCIYMPAGMGQEPQDIITMPLLVGTDGSKKMSKSLDNYIALNDSPSDMFGKVMSIPDELIVSYYELVTNITTEGLEIVKKELAEGKNPRDIKAKLAFLIVELIYDAEQAEQAEAEFEKVFKNKEMPSEMPEKKIENRKWRIDDLLVECDIASSKSDARRLVEQSGVSIDNGKITNSFSNIEIKEGMVINVGRKFVKITK